jgi:flagellar assembly factor FliW
LADGQNSALAWLQSVEQPDIAFAVVSPRRHVPGYRLRVARRELDPLEIEDLQAVRVLAIVGKGERSITLNLKSPLVINLDRRTGRQVIANGDLPVQYELRRTAATRKRIA